MNNLAEVVDKEVIQDTIEKSRMSSRGRAMTVLHPPEKKGIRILVNAIQPGSYVQPHRHEYEEAFGILSGELDVLFFDQEGKVISRNTFNQHNGSRFVEIPPLMYHTVLSNEQDSCILDLSIGPFNPNGYKQFAPWSPSEPEGGMPAYTEEIHEYMTRLRKK